MVATPKVSAQVQVTLELTVTVGPWDAKTDLASLRQTAIQEAKAAIKLALDATPGGKNRFQLGEAVKIGAVLTEMKV
jgi:hypothetical protein